MIQRNCAKTYDDLDYVTAVAMRYHGHRKAFLHRVSRLDPVLSIFFGSAAFATILANFHIVAAITSLLIVGLSAISLAFGIEEKARLHETLFQQWGALRRELVSLSQDDDLALRRLEVAKAEIDAESPWQLYALSVICENEEKDVRGEEALCRVEWYQRALANWFTIPGWRPKLDQRNS